MRLSGSVHALHREMKAAGVVSRRRTQKSGKETGGAPFERGAVFHLLRNRVYVGEIVHRDMHWPGLHPPLMDRDLFDAVQARLSQNAPSRRNGKHPRSPATLTGIIKASDGTPMTPTSVRRRDGFYRYYVCRGLQLGEVLRADGPELRRVSAPALEQAIADALRQLVGQTSAGWEDLRPLLAAVTVHADRVVLHLVPTARVRAVIAIPPADADGLTRWSIDLVLQTRGGRSWLENAGAAKRRPDRALIAGLRRGHAILAEAGMHPSGRTALWRDAKAIDDPYLRSLAQLAFLAPDIQEGILEGRQPPGLTLKDLRLQKIPFSWSDQRSLLGFAA